MSGQFPMRDRWLELTPRPRPGEVGAPKGKSLSIVGFVTPTRRSARPMINLDKNGYGFTVVQFPQVNSPRQQSRSNAKAAPSNPPCRFMHWARLRSKSLTQSRCSTRFP
jgi:hypothetical protein